MNSNEYTQVKQHVQGALSTKIQDEKLTLGETFTVQHILSIKKEAGKIAAQQKISDDNIPQGMKNGMRIMTTLDDAEYIKLVNDNAICPDGSDPDVPAWTFSPPTEPLPYDPAALTVTNAAQREQMLAKHEQKKANYAYYATVEDGLKQAIIAHVPEELISDLDDDEVGFANCTLRELLNQLLTETKQNQGTTKRAELRQTLQEPWNGDKIIKFFKRQETRRSMIEKAGVVISDSQLVDDTVLLIFKAGFLTKQEIEVWENKSAADQTWANVKTYFGDIYRTRTNINPGNTASDLGYGTEQANALQDALRERDEALEQMQAMLAALKEHQKPAAPAQPTPSTEAGLEKTFADFAASMKTLVSEAISEKKNPTKPRGGPKKGLRTCNNCGRQGFHSDERCPDKEENAHLRKANWKPKEERIRLGWQQA